MNSLLTFWDEGSKVRILPFWVVGFGLALSGCCCRCGCIEQIMKVYDFDGAGGVGPLKSWAREM